MPCTTAWASSPSYVLQSQPCGKLLQHAGPVRPSIEQRRHRPERACQRRNHEAQQQQFGARQPRRARGRRPGGRGQSCHSSCVRPAREDPLLAGPRNRTEPFPMRSPTLALGVPGSRYQSTWLGLRRGPQADTHPTSAGTGGALVQAPPISARRRPMRRPSAPSRGPVPVVAARTIAVRRSPKARGPPNQVEPSPGARPAGRPRAPEDEEMAEPGMQRGVPSSPRPESVQPRRPALVRCEGRESAGAERLCRS
jgi:hypothetical protein